MEPRPDDLDDLIAHEPYVRALARRLVLDGVRADDVVQQTWLAALCADRSRIVSVRGWLAAIVRRVASTMRRAEARTERRERLAARPEVDAPADDARAREDARRAVVDAVFGLDEPWRTTLVLRHLDGVPQREIARRMNVPIETVHSRLRRGLELLRQRLDAERDRRAWLLGLVPFAAQPGTVPLAVLTSAVLQGALAMSVGFKSVVAAVTIAAGCLWFAASDPTHVEPPHSSVTSQHAGDAETSRDAESEIAADAATRTVIGGDADPTSTSGSAGALTPTTGIIEVTVRTAESPADPNVVVQVAPRIDRVSRPARARTTGGVARFEGLEPGTYTVSTDRFVETTGVVEAGAVLSVTLDTTSGYRITGRVLDERGAGVSGATISLSRFGQWQEGFDVGLSGADGAYVIDGVGIGVHVGATKAGFAASRMRFVFAGRGERRGDIDLVLRPSGGAIAGRVTDATGEPIVGARIVVDADGILAETRDDGTPHLEVFERFAWSAEDGSFHVDGLVAGPHKVVIRAPGFEPFVATCETRAGETTRVDASPRKGAVIVGTVRRADGTPAADLPVTAGPDGVVSESSTVTSAADGAFRLESLPAGRIVVFAGDPTRGTARVELDAIGGVEQRVDLALELPPGVAGRVEDEFGQPIASARLDARLIDDRSVLGSTTTAQDGTFRIPCGDVLSVDLEVTWGGSVLQPALRVRDVRVGDDDVVIRVPSRTRPTARIVGRVVDARGPVEGAEVLILVANGPQGTLVISGADGSFTSPLLAPSDYHLQVRGTAYAVHSSTWIELGADATHDVGTIRLGSGGSLRVRLQRATDLPDVRPSVWLERLDDGLSVFVDLANDVGTASKVAAGRYVASVGGDGVLARTATVDVHDGEETLVDLPLERAAVDVQFVVQAPSVEAETIRVRIDDASGHRVHAGTAFRFGRTDPFEHRVGLAPGVHRVTLVGPHRTTESREFTVEEGAETVTVELSLP